MDDIELPPLPVGSSRSTRPSRPAILTRKRTREDCLIEDDIPASATSSDPALFSGDEAAPGLELYQSKRKRKMYTGSWYSHTSKARKEDKKREFKRNVDSGIFMGTESETPSSDSIGSMEDALMEDMTKKNNDNFKLKASPLWASERRAAKALSFPTVAAKPIEHELVMQIVHDCLEHGREDVDLSCVRYPTIWTEKLIVYDGRSIRLSSLPREIAELATLTKQPELVNGMLEHGTELEARLRLFLSNNLLRTVPTEILNLTNLRVLSLRQNKLTSLPVGIRKLVNLEELNVSGNKLLYLPFEIIELKRFHNLKEILAEPNAWQRPETRDCVLFKEYGLGRVSGKTDEHASNSARTGNMASLFEQTLRQLSRLEPQNDLRSLMPPSTPDAVNAGLRDLHSGLLAGGRQCTNCHRVLVQPEVEWIEWWSCILLDLLPVKASDLWFPVKRMSCSRDCSGTVNEWIDSSGEYYDCIAGRYPIERSLAPIDHSYT